MGKNIIMRSHEKYDVAMCTQELLLHVILTALSLIMNKIGENLVSCTLV